MNDQARKLREMVKNSEIRRAHPKVETTQNHGSGQCRTIAVTSGKGGVGKTTVSLSLALSLSTMHKKVLLMDADLGLANLHILLGIAPRQSISDVISGDCSLEAIILKGPGGIELIPGASGLEELANIDIGRMERLRLDFMHLEQRYDYMIIDTGAGIGSVVTHFASHSDMVLLVMTPEPTSLADAYAMVKVLYERGSTNIKVAVNMAGTDREGVETFDRLNALVIKFLKRPLELTGLFFTDREIQKSIRLGRLPVTDTRNRFMLRSNAVAKRICGSRHADRSGFFAGLLGWKKSSAFEC